LRSGNGKTFIITRKRSQKKRTEKEQKTALASQASRAEMQGPQNPARRIGIHRQAW
jgi:hypothetical protein